jgi:hypothetical protein
MSNRRSVRSSPPHPEAPAASTEPALHLDRLSPKEVVDLHRYLIQAERDDNEGRIRDEPNSYEKRLRPYTDILERALVELAQSDPDRAFNICTAYLDSPLPDDRGEAAYLIHELSVVKYPGRRALWDRILRDPDSAVRNRAWSVFDMPSADDRHAHDWLGRMGLTGFEVATLCSSYYQAERGHFIYDVGRLALEKAIQPPDAYQV